jgi:hypothetical protein
MAGKGGADAAQLEVLGKGEVSFADYEAAVYRTVECMTQAGLDVIAPQVVDRGGLDMVEYSWSSQVEGLTEEQGFALGDACLTQHSRWVEMQWQLQPSAVEARERYFDNYRDTVVGCIRDHGGTVADDATRTEAVRASIEVEDATGIDCFGESGLGI